MDDAEPTVRVARKRAHEDRAHVEQLLQRAAASASQWLMQLSRCESEIADLVGERIERAWTNGEHASYLKLRRQEEALQRNAGRARRVFDHARARLHDIDSRR